jgi:alpha-L-fucosidase
MARIDWFNEARFGMFIHWGAYSVAGRGEWAFNRERIPKDEYVERYVNEFRAEHYDPSAWAALAKAAGMGYLVLTTRHHDGFALWNTATSDFHAGRLGPKRDLVGPFVEAVRGAGLRVGLYFSPADWNHPDYPGAYERDWPTLWRDEAARRRFVAYYQAQLRELLTRYGKIDLLWYDGCIPLPLEGETTNAMVRELQPDILMNDRLGKPCDFECSEQTIKPKDGPWEACMTLNDNWGYHAGDTAWKPPAEVVRLLLTCGKDGGNLLLNVGPHGDGTIPEPSIAILREVGAWVRRNGECLPHSGRSPFTWNTSGVVTVRERSVYLHLLKSPGPEFCWGELKNRVLRATFVATGKPVAFRQEGARLFLTGLPFPLIEPLATTIRLEVEGTPEPITKQETFWIPG